MRSQHCYTLPTWAAWLIGLGAVGCITGFTLWLQLGPLGETARCFLQNPLLLLLNLWPIAATMALLVCLLENVFFSASLTTLLWSILSYINLVKISSRGDPFVPGDVLLLTEGLEAVGSYSLDLHLERVALIGCICLGLVILGLVLKTPSPRPAFRLGGFAAVLAAFVVTMATCYPSNSLYQSFRGPERSNVPQVFEQFGFPYCFLHNFNLYPVDKPEGYQESIVQELMQDYAAEPVCPEVKPNILMVMCEAFTDLPNRELFTYGEQDNPIADFNRLAAEKNTISGHLVVSNTGAGTANTEFDILTGMMTNRLSPATTSAFRVVRRSTPSIPRALEAVGYHNFFMHPGQNWFYNRESVYNFLGITDQVFRDAFVQADYKGSWISDQGFLRVLGDCLDEREDQSPLFAYTVTIQNHQSYTLDKYGFLPELPKTDMPLTEETRQCLAVYFEGLRDSANMLEALTEDLNTRSEPYILVFFGDHQPNLGNGYGELGLKKTDSTEDLLSQYQVPFLIWANDSYLAENDLLSQAQEAGLQDGDVISSHYLGALTCQIAGFRGLDGYDDYLNELRQALPVESVYGYRLADGTYTNTLPQNLEEAVMNRWHWQYYRLKAQKTA